MMRQKENQPMNNLSRRTFLELAGASLVCGCSASTSLSDGVDYPVLAFSDLHFNPLYDSTNTKLINNLVAADVSEWASLFQSSPITTLSPAGADTNYPLLALTLAGIKQLRGASPILLYTGDLLGHQISTNLSLYVGITDPTVIQDFSNKALTFVTRQIRSAADNIPVMFAVGNCDSYTGYGPDSTFLASTAASYYAELLNSSTDRQEFLASFTAGGYYSAEPAGTNLMVIGLNTIAFSPLVQNKDGSENNAGAVDAQLAWFDAKLAAAKAAGKKVWLLMHAPPGADEGTTAKSVDSSGHLASSTMMWEPNYQAAFMGVVSKYPEVIAMTLAGHTHMDEYRIMSAGNVVEIVPGISPVFGNDPAFKIFTVNQNTLAPTDYSSFNCDLSKPQSQFNAYYKFSEKYALSGSLGSSLEQLNPKLVTSSALQALYRGYYYSGNNAACPINDTNWPVYWGGIGKMWAQDLTNAVNSYR
jgi:sphingomyelin phosphodiesterase acid-like 3